MKSRTARVFWTAFFSVLLLFATLFGVYCVDRASGESGMGSFFGEMRLSVSREKLTLMRGREEWTWSFSPPEEAVRLLRETGGVILPRGVRFAVQWWCRFTAPKEEEAPPQKEFRNADFL